MKRFISLLVMFICAASFFIGPCVEGAVTLKDEKSYDPLEVLQALNYCTYSLSKIVSFNDRVVLSFEYDNIINNLNLNAITDEEIVKLMAKLMDTLKDEIISERKRERIEKSYQKRLERTLYNFLSGVNVSPQSVVSAAVSAVSSMGSMYVNYQRRIEEYMDESEEIIEALDDEKLDVINSIRKDMLTASWSIIKKYNIDDQYRLTEKQINEFVENVKSNPAEMQHRKLERLLQDNPAFEYFPPFWYYYSLTREEDEVFVLGCLNRFLQTQRPIFRRDILWASVLMERVRLQKETDSQSIRADLEEIIRQSNNSDWQNFLFVGLAYTKLGMVDEARRNLQRNIDNGYEVSLNSRLLAEILLDAGDQLQFEETMKKMLSDTRVSNSDKLYLIGRCRNVTYLNRFKEEISEIRLSAVNEAAATELVNPTYLLTIPNKWLVEDASFDVRLFNENIDRSHHFESIDDPALVISTKKKRVAIKFPETGHTIARKPEKGITVNIKHPLIDMTLIYELEKKDIGRAAKTLIEAAVPFYSEVLGNYRLKEVAFMDERYIFTAKGILAESKDNK